MTQSVGDRIDTLRATMTGPVVVPGDRDYDEVRRIWNAAIDRKPAVVARCSTAADVSAAVTFATEHGLEISVRGGAHGVSGQCVVDDGMMIDLSLLNAVSVDPQARRARVGGGALLGDLVEASQQHGLCLPVGAISHTGVGGLTLGGGMGWLTRKHGLTIDNMVSAEVVLADGRVVRASETENSDLFWAIRGGGGNFGVVTEFEFALHPVGPIVQFTMLFWPLEQGVEFLRVARDVVGSLPAEVNVIFGGLNAPPAPFVPEEHQLKPGYGAVVVNFGSSNEHEGVVKRLRDGATPLFEFATPMPYTALQQMLDEANAWGFHDYEKGAYVEELTDGATDVIAEHIAKKTSPLSAALFYRLDGAYSAVADDDTAFGGGRSPRYGVFIIAICPVPEMLAAEREWVRGFHAALTPYADPGTYVNALHDDNDAVVRASYGSDKYERLVRIKQKYDPANVFHRNVNIKPTSPAPAQRQPEHEATRQPTAGG